MELQLKMTSVQHIGEISKEYFLWALVESTWCYIGGHRGHRDRNLLQLFTISWRLRR